MKYHKVTIFVPQDTSLYNNLDKIHFYESRLHKKYVHYSIKWLQDFLCPRITPNHAHRRYMVTYTFTNYN